MPANSETVKRRDGCLVTSIHRAVESKVFSENLLAYLPDTPFGERPPKSLVLTAAPSAAVSEKQDEEEQQDRHCRERHRLPHAPRVYGDAVYDQRETSD